MVMQSGQRRCIPYYYLKPAHSIGNAVGFRESHLRTVYLDESTNP
jgi:hypothetical protein